MEYTFGLNQNLNTNLIWDPSLGPTIRMSYHEN